MGFEAEYDGPLFDWPGYHRVTEEERPYVQHVRNKYAALLQMCDRNLGKILDKMDEYNLWEDTMLIVNTDHGLSLIHIWAGIYAQGPGSKASLPLRGHQRVCGIRLCPGSDPDGSGI